MESHLDMYYIMFRHSGLYTLVFPVSCIEIVDFTFLTCHNYLHSKCCGSASEHRLQLLYLLV